MTQPSFVYFRPTKITFIRTDGASESAIEAAWNTLENALAKSSRGAAIQINRAYGLHWRRLAGVRDGEKYEAAIEQLPDLELDDALQAGTRTLPGGSYASTPYAPSEGPRLAAIGQAVDAVADSAGCAVDPRRPVIEVLKMSGGERFADARIDICVPVTPRGAEPASR
jgi:hypothetical protein